MITVHKYVKPFISVWIYYPFIFILAATSFYAFIFFELSIIFFLVLFILSYLFSVLFLSPYVYIKKIKFNGIEKYEMFKKLNNTSISFIKNTKQLHNEREPAYHSGTQLVHYVNYNDFEFWVGNKKIEIKEHVFTNKMDNIRKLYKIQKNIKEFN